ncbi:hypothetical protein bthur0010_57410 [Bacillus thuringiensis serovar pondicheriensis BGSC 4BA1]|nr:hypothetical protein bthur0010_57410 [Bacillus thuringiensis serovar pondicheriensis BGSC 4BA1]
MKEQIPGAALFLLVVYKSGDSGYMFPFLLIFHAISTLMYI